MTLVKPFMNNALIEVLFENQEVFRADVSETLKVGKIVSVSVNQYHLTASSFGEVNQEYAKQVQGALKPGTIVRWEEFAEGGQTFKDKDGKTYALIPWWRIISYEGESNDKE